MTRAYTPPPAEPAREPYWSLAASFGLFFAALIFCLTVWGASL